MPICVVRIDAQLSSIHILTKIDGKKLYLPIE